MSYRSAVALVACLLAAPASAATYTFSFDGSSAYPGTVSGILEGLNDNGLGQSATSATITSVTGSPVDFSFLYGFNFLASYAYSPDQYYFNEAMQHFDVVNGNIVNAEFVTLSQGLARTSAGTDFLYLLCFFSAGGACPGYLHAYTQDLETKIILRPAVDGPTVTFARLPDLPSAVPLPAGAGLLAAALVLLFALARPSHPTHRRKFG